MKQIGITGGIGSGKSSICNAFQLLGAPVYEADAEAKKLQDENQEIKRGLIALFGPSIYFGNGKLNRKKLAGFIFSEKSSLNKVNQLVHPVVHAHYKHWLTVNSHVPYIIYEAAILFESGFYKDMDEVILVTAPEEMRIARVVNRDKLTPEEVKSRVRNQWPEDEKRKLADYIIENDNSSLVIPQVIELDKIFRNNGKIR
ncbi:dephospho-CoA kinase [Prolixibacter sp. SD074]|jgi:dephospho-CoA kinase|uniref:dephospho-CoA kinase n=1 Tax=Prolixibacter sp. SD074 TaxID=2652391 RepID=UPI00126A9285|nr:dephospho-CoA kinase [Prolixibacter sp. SD074]GET28430.1 dephospho-CoA kinase [Prolixibacter sp. SD074]